MRENGRQVKLGSMRVKQSRQDVDVTSANERVNHADNERGSRMGKPIASRRKEK